MSPDTPIQHQEDKFLASEKNKQNMQIVLRELFQKISFECKIYINHLFNFVSILGSGGSNEKF